ncbi:hypothetical protein LguiB_021743 [Lonicera macranthoides]
MGREIINQESLEPGERSRLWNHEEAFNVLKNETDSRKIEGLILDMHMLKQDVNISKKRRYKEFLDKSSCSNQMTSIKRHCFNFFSGQTLFKDVGSSDEVYLRTNAFKEMKILRLRQLNYAQIYGCEFPEEMRNMESLKVFKADRIVINPSEDTSTWGTKWWHTPVWSTMSKPTKGPEVLWAFFPCSLTRLSLPECNLSDDSFPHNFINLPSLYELNLSRNPFL